ncbi:S-methyl-5-thioribose-1-phosphate isomerase [candidate division WOR-1 bacterium RIFCSPLOWO2_02_FULL_46_20]|uniref:Methylthioribose-1-phosphate isomerase n=1 Tax=candidate division WOR-1 bacterium RIFCSPLOWO2_02_FULL_46_20 TaxID=1802567 RepID=A0A1F4R8X2_UNCSA|nr:MAG: S-methyl-5-thioribose-1-phosphate isomerase [candidate division WOR-1 bacterium RIFCSPHIGHO2_02_FULL_45_12]OGC04622.1 MAG: S-methyl-5-thioribose-1-phosphate isomerase [candidate division WOR-1 bacterium RIFCSPLOWO2_02_FULL_46_20]
MRTIEWKNNKVKIVDQTLLPNRLKFIHLKNLSEVVRAIKIMQIRGAPALGAAAAFGLVLGAANLKRAARDLLNSRPTAVNIRWAVERMLKVPNPNKKSLLAEALKIAEEDVEINKKLGAYGARLIKSGMKILTVCNAGALATVDYGTAIGVIRAAHDQGKKIHVYPAETRPRLQGAKLTAWELKQAKIPFTLITDNMIGYHMQKGLIDVVVVGADRIAKNGDTANKIGTYAAAVLAKAHGIPFYIAAPFSTVDLQTKTGSDIVIEERTPAEVTDIGKTRIAPKGIKVANPAFDVTPARLIKGIITERGIFKPGTIR